MPHNSCVAKTEQAFPGDGALMQEREADGFVPGTAMTGEELTRYAKTLIVSSGTRPGDSILLKFTTNAQMPLLMEIADQSRQTGIQVDFVKEFAGANLGEIAAQGPKVVRAVSSRAVFMSLDSNETFPAPAETEEMFQARQRAYSQAWSSYGAAKSDNAVRWNISPWPTEAWAEKVFPELPPAKALRKLTLIVGQATGSHLSDQQRQAKREALDTRARKISDLGLTKLKLQSSNTNLTMNISPGAEFSRVAWETSLGDYMQVNSPSEEVFTTPDPASVSGSFTLTRPVVMPTQTGSKAIEGVVGTFKSGKLIEMATDDPNDQAILDHYFSDGFGTDRVGEVGLVDQQGVLAKSGATFYSTLLDENTGVHLGLGSSFEAITGGTVGNPAKAHFDVVVGSEEMTVTGEDRHGNKHVLISGGKFQI